MAISPIMKAKELTGKVAAEEDPQAQLVSTYRRRLSMALN